jgi:hypothetical protein
MTNWTRRTLCVCLSAAAVSLASCGGSSTTAPSAPTPYPAPTRTLAATSTTAPSTPTPQSTPTEDVIAAAAAAYSLWTGNYNACVAGVNTAAETAIPPNWEYSALVPSSHTWLVCEQVFQAALFQIPFPPSVSTQASAMAAAVQTDIASFQDFIANPDATTWQAVVDAQGASSSASAAIRIALHLPPPPSSTP